LSSHKRHIYKAVTWRIVGTIDTLVIGTLITGSSEDGFKIGLAEVVTKIILYYLHERIWFNIRTSLTNKSIVRHALKSFSWRILGSLDTILLSWFISGSFILGITIGGIDFFTKIILYFIHERIWHKSKFGISNPITNE
jgi:uncharacterized membrane protein